MACVLNFFLLWLSSFCNRRLCWLQTDSVSISQPQFPGHIGLPFSDSLHTEVWIFLFLALLLLFVVLAVLFSSSSLLEFITVFFNPENRGASPFSSTVLYSVSRFLFLVFFAGLMSLLACLYFNPSDEAQIFCSRYLLYFVATVLFLIIKWFLFNFIAFVFFNSTATVKIAKELYFNLLSLLGLFLYPFLLFYAYSSFFTREMLLVVVITLLVFALIFWAFRLFQIFFSKVLDSFYILLYLCTLEILPLLLLFRVYQNII